MPLVVRRAARKLRATQNRVVFMEENLRRPVLFGLAAIVLIALPAAAFAEDLKFKLTNNSSRAIQNFYTSPANTTDWKEDVLGEATIPPGQTDEITIADGSTQCVYDMRFVMEDKQEMVESGIDLCKLAEYTLSDAK